MKSSRCISGLAKSKVTRAIALMAALLLTLEPFAFALNQIVDRYPTGYTAATVDMGGGNLLPRGSVFGFNSAKSGSDTDAYAEVREGACIPEATSYNFASGAEGFAGTPVTDVTYGQTLAVGSGAYRVALGRANRSRTYTVEKKFFYDCGTPTTVNFAMKHARGAGTWGGTGTNNFSVVLVRPDTTTKTLVSATNIAAGTSTTPTATTITTQPVTTDLTQVGTYTLRITGTISTATSQGSRVEFIFDDIILSKASSYESFQTDVEFTLAATPYKSATGTYKLDMRARRAAGDTENTNLQVWNGSSWTTRYTVNNDTTFVTYDTYNLTDPEYNNGTVRVKFVDATPTADSTQGGVDVEYLRVTVDQGICVDQVTDTVSDCGKCHNYGGDITKPWPNQGMHNKHAQSESASDCLWCHVNNGTDSGHSNGGQIELGGTKLFRLGGANPNGAPATATYDTATGRCSNIACHKGLQTPAWTATYGLTQASINGTTIIARNCSRCHNNGTPGADTYTGSAVSYAPNIADYNLDKAWPNDAGQGHSKHDAAFTINALSCVTNGSCHPNNLGQHTVVDDGKIEVKMAGAYASPNKVVKYFPTTKTCANVACHGGQQTPAFNVANTNPIDVPTQCDKCHLAEQASGWGTSAGQASQWNSAISGLHRGGAPTSETTHTGLTATTCRDCHNSPVKHFREGGAGTDTNLHTLGMDLLTGADFKAPVGVTLGSGGTRPNWTTPTSCMVATGAQAMPNTGCHTESNTAFRNPATQWARKWSWDAYSATEIDRCKNCHGHWTNFATGMSQPHLTSNSDGTLRSALITNHAESGVNCATLCHGQTDPAYNHGVAPTATTKDMTLNSNSGIVKTAGPPARVGCNFCHSANDGSTPDGGGPATNHIFTETNWVTDTAANGPTPTCYNPGAASGCHGNGTSEYWPNGTAYPDNEGRHDEHMVKIAAKLAITLPGTDAEQKRMCQYCHPANPGAAGHSTNSGDSIADVSGINPLWDVANPPATTDTGAAFSNNAAATCASIDCHNNKTTTAGTFGWRDAGTSTCLMCHNNDGSGTNNPTTGLHFGTLTVSANTHDDTFQITKGGASTATCITCHTSSPSSAHINGTFNSSPSAVAAIITFATTVGFTDSATAPTCTPNGALSTCHTDGGSWSRLWSTTAKNSNGTECANCHGGFSGSDWTFGVGAALNNTTDYNVSHSRDWDGDATQNETYGSHSSNTANTNKCNTCHVYGDGAYVWGTYHNNGKITMNSTLGYSGTTFNCTTTCHANNTNHNLEASSSVAWATRGESLAGPALSCTSCHGGATPKAGVSSTSPHVTRGRGAGYNTFNACTDCHPGGTKGAQHAKSGHANVILIPNDTTAGINYVNGTNGYSGDTGMVLGGDATAAVTTEAEICWGCHTNDTYNLSTTKTTITFVDGGANNDTIVDSASGLGGFAVGKLVTVTGSSQAGNNKTFPIVAIAANSISVPSGSLTADGTAGESVTLRERISEWGMNTDTNGAASNYSFGGIYTSSAGTTQATAWLTNTSVASNATYWISDVRGIGTGGQSFSYKTGRTQSTHAASSAGVSGLDAVANLRCSYCHDVHNTKSGSPSGAPYLRGTWMGSPYREDGAPQAGQTYATSATNHGSVPRATNATTTLGGYQIDQNNGNPTTGGTAAHTTAVNATWALANSAGLCIMCHSEGVDNLNKFGTAADAWVGTNGHSNAAIGGTGSAKANIFTMSGTSGTGNNTIEGRFSSSATPALYTSSGQYRGAPRISYLNAGAIDDTSVTGDASSDQRGYGFRSQDSGGYMFTPQVTTGSPYAYNGYNWGAHADDSAAQTLYHKFSCSKCHNPHASRLPRLMMTNCLDTRLNTWDDALSTISGTGVSTENASAKITQLTSAQNCHRYKNTAQGAGARGLGWNRVTPWTTEGTQTNGVIP